MFQFCKSLTICTQLYFLLSGELRQPEDTCRIIPLDQQVTLTMVLQTRAIIGIAGTMFAFLVTSKLFFIPLIEMNKQQKLSGEMEAFLERRKLAEAGNTADNEQSS